MQMSLTDESIYALLPPPSIPPATRVGNMMVECRNAFSGFFCRSAHMRFDFDLYPRRPFKSSPVPWRSDRIKPDAFRNCTTRTNV